MKTAVIYARFSCSKQREASIEDQLRVCREWCEQEGYSIVREYCDHAKTGKTDDRPEFQQMIANAGESDIVLVYMMDRFSRDPFDAPIYKKELAKVGVRLVSALEAIPESPEGIIYEKLLEGLAACESMKTSVRTRRGMEGNALKCQHNGVMVYGYKVAEDGTYEIDDEQAAFVREAFERRICGETTNAIAKDFALRGVLTYTGKPCGHTMVYNILRNEKYLGIYKWGNVRIEGGMPRIIDDETFERARRAKARKMRINENFGDYLLTGKAICGKCGHNLQGVSGRGGHNKKYEYYDCRKCDSKAHRRELVEGATANAIRELLSDREEATRVARIALEASNTSEVNIARENAQKALKAAESGLANILKAIEQGIIAPGAKERIAELEAQRDRATVELASLTRPKIDVEELATFLMGGTYLDDATILDAFVYQVLIYDDEAIVSLNYGHEKAEPVKLDVSLVLPNCVWLPG